MAIRIRFAVISSCASSSAVTKLPNARLRLMFSSRTFASSAIIRSPTGSPPPRRLLRSGAGDSAGVVAAVGTGVGAGAAGTGAGAAATGVGS